jgi:hypothetical protein
MLIVVIISIVIACILSFLIVKVWSKPGEVSTPSSVSTSHPELGAIHPDPLKPVPGTSGTGNSEG